MSLNLKLLGGIIVIVSVVTTIGYGAIMLNENLNRDSNQIILNQTAYSNAKQDPYNIYNVILEADLLTIAVRYGGGCADHDFSLIGSTSFMESSPVQLNILLSHNANGDNCEALLMKELVYDISPIKNLYQLSYSETSGTVILNLKGSNDSINYQF
ncbi:MAG: hypothetical protein ACW964_12560 [Candidatus Hodarchaeales archaeon]|jgi:hypothetical protein